MTNNVTQFTAASSADAIAHFGDSFKYETDCWDVHDAFGKGADDFIVLDVRSPAAYAKGHVKGAINLPVGKIVASKLKQWPNDMLFVTYCAGPHCNGASKGAVRLAQLGRPCKIMIGGITGWIDEGFDLVTE
ncbi:MAG: rhodanese-like domain-containing protein [Alphaproteobacteria bacterium]|nr:rhodanese-like domain-containing protein [Alphaproteobacteria bacterium]